MSDEKDEGLVTVPQNVFGIKPKDRERRYIADPVKQKKWLEFNNLERNVLLARIRELNSRAEQILYIYVCHKTGAYMAGADTSKKRGPGRISDFYFHQWLDELAIQGIAYAARRPRYKGSNNYGGPHDKAYRWDEIEEVIELCLSKGLDIEVAAKVAAVGVKAVQNYLEHGIISPDEEVEKNVTDSDTPVPTSEPQPERKNDRGESEADILGQLAQATSSRDASIMARDRISADFVRVSAINRCADGDQDKPDFTKYYAEAQVVSRSTGEYTPYAAFVYFPQDMPEMAVKFMLSKWSEALARIL